VDTSIKFYVWVNPRVRKEDFPNLPEELRERFDTLFLRILAVDPYNRRGLKGHTLERELRGYRTIDVQHNGLPYRLVYLIDDSPDVMEVKVYTFERHDPAYERARNRALGWK
jgi:mRNA interferase RelE/StbE